MAANPYNAQDIALFRLMLQQQQQPPQFSPVQIRSNELGPALVEGLAQGAGNAVNMYNQRRYQQAALEQLQGMMTQQQQAKEAEQLRQQGALERLVNAYDLNPALVADPQALRSAINQKVEFNNKEQSALTQIQSLIDAGLPAKQAVAAVRNNLQGSFTEGMSKVFNQGVIGKALEGVDTNTPEGQNKYRQLTGSLPVTQDSIYNDITLPRLQFEETQANNAANRGMRQQGLNIQQQGLTLRENEASKPKSTFQYLYQNLPQDELLPLAKESFQSGPFGSLGPLLMSDGLSGKPAQNSGRFGNKPQPKQQTAKPTKPVVKQSNLQKLLKDQGGIDMALADVRGKKQNALNKVAELNQNIQGYQDVNAGFDNVLGGLNGLLQQINQQESRLKRLGY